MNHESRTDLTERMAAFARARIAPRDDLHALESFPLDIWRGMAEDGLLGVGIAPHHGGVGGDWRDVSALARTLSAEGGNLGMAMSWLVHIVVSRLIVGGFGTPAQTEDLLPKLAHGTITPCVAISEPGAGAHPKRLTARAERTDGGFVLNGEKTYLTNGPIADLFVVLAITVEVDGRKRFSAFLVDKDNPGLELTPTLPVDFLKPSPHCGIRLTDCRVVADAMLGPEGEAFETMSTAMRAVEDTIGLGSMTGAVTHQIDLLAAAAMDGTDDFAAALGAAAAMPAGLRAMAEAAASVLDRFGPRDPGLGDLAAAFRATVRHTQELIGEARVNATLADTARLDIATHDVVKTLGIAGAAHRLNDAKRGRAYLIE
ncbi:MAG: acyl-CoA/acyl-ACP dehydrogenase [Minwuiales bacterium]|nr:acyl-CoA/acyl-ACP dehydrogenase [Minwuiales bacterium]